MGKKVSIIIPVYNVERFVERCLNSVINQTYKNLEIIVINDGSTDKSADVIEKFLKIDKRIIYIMKENGGIADTRNCALEKVSGEYILFVDSDDFLNFRTVEILVQEALLSNADIVASSYQNVYENDDRIYERENIKSNFIRGNNELFYRQIITNHPWAKLYKKELFDKLLIKYPLHRNYEDVSTTYILFDNSKNISYTDSKLYYYFMRNSSITHVFSKKNIRDFELAYQEIKQYFKTKQSENTNYYLLTLLFTIFSLLMKADNKEFAVEEEKKVRKEFNKISKSVNLKNYKSSPMSLKLFLYKIHLAKPITKIKNKLK